MVLILIGIIIFIAYLFLSDKNEIKKKNIMRGGIKRKYPNFVAWCENELSIIDELKKEFVKDDGEYLEYRLPIKREGRVRAYIFYGIQDTLGTFAYCYVTSINGYQTPKRFIELKSQFGGIPDQTYFDYESIYDNLLRSVLTQTEMDKIDL